MSKTKKKKAAKTILTLHLPTAVDGGIQEDERTATLLIQRGDLGQARQFPYSGMLDQIVEAIREGTEALGLIEDNPPVVPEAPEEKKKRSKSKHKQAKVQDEEPTIEVPLKKGTQSVKMSYIKIVSGESDAAAYKQAVMLAGRLINGGLWDGESPIRFENVPEVAKKMKSLQDKELSLFELTDFVKTGETGTEAEVAETQETDDATEAETAGATDETPEAEANETQEVVATTEEAPEAETAGTTDEIPEAEADETQEVVATAESENPYLHVLEEKIASDDADLLEKIAGRIDERMEESIHLTGFWTTSPGQNQLKADLQAILLSPDYLHLPGLIDLRLEIIEAVLDIAKPETGEKSYPETLDSPAKRAFYDRLQDSELADMIHEEILTGKKHGWKGDLLKERLVKGIIAAYVDGKAEKVEALFDIALKSEEFDDKVSV